MTTYVSPIKQILIVTISLFTLIACSKKNEALEEKGNSITIKDLPGDTSASMQTGGTASFKNLYFSFTTGTAVTISDADKTTTKWDLAFTGPYNSEVYVNYGGYKYNPGYNGPGVGAVIQIDKSYDQVTEAPSPAEFDAASMTKIGWDSGSGTGWFFYSMDNHIAVPIKNRTFVIRTAGGKFAKLELINVYKGNPPVVTDLFWPAPYFTFRYFVQQDGSSNLSTN
ncbi:HmuY family protein [Niastella sp. OAS944]|uniref:HmuY family protein n=1 Tax=Niastella sp. OAS944 TaxID=2664089 RepID=UPI0034939638|nr:hypothetical protein [Chitinophagaceae bacterium OAS944]